MSSPRTELAVAIRRVNVAYAKLTAAQRARVQFVDDGNLDRALLSGTVEEQFDQVDRWEQEQLAAIEEATR